MKLKRSIYRFSPMFAINFNILKIEYPIKVNKVLNYCIRLFFFAKCVCICMFKELWKKVL